MIHYLRKIRFSLFKGKGVKKYIFYAIGEIVLVVLGILMALKISDWNTYQVDRQNEFIYYNKLLEDLNKQEQVLSNGIRLDSIINDQSNHILHRYIKDDLFNLDSLNRVMLTQIMIPPFYNINSTYRELESTGKLLLIHNDSLRSHIVEFYQTLDEFEFQYQNNINNIFYPYLLPVFTSNIIIPNTNIRSEFPKRLLKSAQKRLSDKDELQIVNALNLRIVIFNGFITKQKALRIQATNLLEQINSEQSLLVSNGFHKD